MEREKLFDLFIINLGTVSARTVKVHSARCVSQRIKIAVISTSDRDEVERRLDRVLVPANAVKIYCGDDLEKTITSAMASVSALDRICYVDNSSAGLAVAKRRGIGHAILSDELTEIFLPVPRKIAATAATK